jgi:GLPGLI family protein
LFLLSCDSIDFSSQPQGVLEYNVVYLSNKSSMPTNLLPKKIILKFKAHKSITTIEGFMGMFALSNLSDYRKQTNTMMLKVMDNRYFYAGEKFEPPFFFDDLKNFDITLVNETKLIAGLNCKKAIVSFNDTIRPPFEIYYTTQINIKNVNKSNPFKTINGLLMQFNIHISNIEMQLTANKYKPDNIPDDEFDISKNYKKVSREKMAGVIDKLLE